jgi:FtsP/CotA-like multicopper oxidase with cupredoxin domain
MFYHCHVQHHVHFLMGLQGMFVVEENRPNNWVQTLNVGAGHVRHPSVAVREVYDQEYDLHYQDMDRTLHELVRTANDPRLIAKAMRLYDITDDAPDYFLLNGRSFPYTLRESLVVVEPNENVKLRVLNGGEHGISLHPHGHKVTITHYDGVEHNPAAQITRDVIWLSSAQRVDLHLKTVNDGLHSNGEGAWMLHDHKETGVTTDGIYPGGNVSLIVYRSFLDGNAMPKTHGIDLKFFNAKYYDRKVPVWATYDEGQMLSDVVESRPLLSRMILLSFVVGLLLGGFACVVRSARKRSMR